MNTEFAPEAVALGEVRRASRELQAAGYRFDPITAPFMIEEQARRYARACGATPAQIAAATRAGYAEARALRFGTSAVA